MALRKKLDIILILFVTALVLANLLGSKITSFALPDLVAAPLNVIFFPLIWLLNQILTLFGGRPMNMAFFNTIQVSVGIIVFPITFLATDVIAEVFGKKEARRLIQMGCVALVMVALVTLAAVSLPAAQRSIDDGAYRLIFSSGFRITMASLLAFMIAQTHDVWAFYFWKTMTRGRFMWLRNNLSTTFSQLIDSTIFMFVAYYQMTPQFTATYVVSLIVPYWVLKIIFALVDTPFCYLGVAWLRGTWGRLPVINADPIVESEVNPV